MTKQKFNPFQIAAMFVANGFVYGLNALYYCFIQIYLEQYHDPVNAGILLAIGPFVSIFAPMFWGVRADKAKYKNNVLAVACLGAAIVYFAIQFSANFWYQFAILVVLMFFMSPYGGLIDIITLEYTAESGFPYGPIRLMGTIVFGVLPMILTIFTETNINLIFYVYVVMAIISAISLLTMPKVQGHAKTNEKISFKPLFGDHRLMVIFATIAVSQFTWAYYLNFFPSHLTGTLGLPQTVWGVNVFVTVLGEIPFFLMFNRIFRRYGIRRVSTVALVLQIVRYLGLGLFTNAPLLLATGLITGFSVTVFTYCGSIYINDNMEPEMKASSQTVMYALTNGIPKVLAGVFGGFMTKGLGVSMSMMLCVGLTVLVCILFAFTLLTDKSPKVN